jgi:hypothetical protein
VDARGRWSARAGVELAAAGPAAKADRRPAVVVPKAIRTVIIHTVPFSPLGPLGM